MMLQPATNPASVSLTSLGSLYSSNRTLSAPRRGAHTTCKEGEGEDECIQEGGVEDRHAVLSMQDRVPPRAEAGQAEGWLWASDPPLPPLHPAPTSAPHPPPLPASPHLHHGPDGISLGHPSPPCSSSPPPWARFPPRLPPAPPLLPRVPASPLRPSPHLHHGSDSISLSHRNHGCTLGLLMEEVERALDGFFAGLVGHLREVGGWGVEVGVRDRRLEVGGWGVEV